MARSVSKIPVWAATIEDKPGGLAEKLAPLAAAGANLDFVIAVAAQPFVIGRGDRQKGAIVGRLEAGCITQCD